MSSNGRARADATAGAQSPGRTRAPRGPRTVKRLHVAAVTAADGIRFLAAGFSADAVLAQVSGYIERQADVALWPRDARRVRDFIGRSQVRSAIDLYFSATGDRWDAERLHYETVALLPE